MRQFFLSITLLLFVITCSAYEPQVEAKLGYFFFADQTMSKIYKEGGVDVQLSGSYPIWESLQLYGSAEYVQKRGSSLGDHEKTRIQLVPINLGLKQMINLPYCTQGYLGIGPRYLYVHANNNSPYVDRTLNRNGCGGFVNAGLLIDYLDCLTFDIFGEYSYVKMRFHSSMSGVYTPRQQLGGVTFGGGVGYVF